MYKLSGLLRNRVYRKWFFLKFRDEDLRMFDEELSVLMYYFI